jgi:hypothetical protein
MIARMAQVIALVASPLRFSQLDMLRGLIVCTCALALIAAGNARPF